jgi:hypothetical protein
LVQEELLPLKSGVPAGAAMLPHHNRKKRFTDIAYSFKGVSIALLAPIVAGFVVPYKIT